MPEDLHFESFWSVRKVCQIPWARHGTTILSYFILFYSTLRHHHWIPLVLIFELVWHPTSIRWLKLLLFHVYARLAFTFVAFCSYGPGFAGRLACASSVPARCSRWNPPLSLVLSGSGNMQPSREALAFHDCGNLCDEESTSLEECWQKTEWNESWSWSGFCLCEQTGWLRSFSCRMLSNERSCAASSMQKML